MHWRLPFGAGVCCSVGSMGRLWVMQLYSQQRVRMLPPSEVEASTHRPPRRCGQ